MFVSRKRRLSESDLYANSCVQSPRLLWREKHALLVRSKCLNHQFRRITPFGSTLGMAFKNFCFVCTSQPRIVLLFIFVYIRTPKIPFAKRYSRNSVRPTRVIRNACKFQDADEKLSLTAHVGFGKLFLSEKNTARYVLPGKNVDMFFSPRKKWQIQKSGA